MTTNKEELSEDKALPEKEYSLKNLEDCVQKLYDYRDHYFERNTIDDASKRKNDIDIQLKNTLDELDKFQDVIQKEDKPMFYYLKGKSLNVTADFDKNALDLLSKAVKLDPKLVDAWNELGECYWKNDNIKEAKNCFNGALAQRRNKISLRNLSMVYRQECATTKEQQIENIQKGVSYAKEALDLDLNDGNSWAVLGNAHLSNYFLISQNPRTLKMCMSAYNQAKRDIIARNNPDLHYNVGIALKYEEEYLAALNSFSRAQALDPTWDFPKIKEERLLKYLESVNELVATNGRMKGRKLQQLIQSIDNKPSIQDLLTVSISSLKPGINKNVILCGKVVCSVQNEDSVPFTFCLIDKESTCIMVSVYNLAEGKGVIIGDLVAIPEPFYSEVHVIYKDKTYNFKKIRVESPLSLIVNGKKLNRNQQAGTRMTTFKKSS